MSQTKVLFRKLMREGNVTLLYILYFVNNNIGMKFKDYNFREYSLRRIRDGFRENKYILIPIICNTVLLILSTVTEPQKLKSLMEEGNRDLELLKRQTVINNLYSQRPTVLENPGHPQK